MEKITEIMTTNVAGSKKQVVQKRVTFKELWNNYPDDEDEYLHNAKEIKDYCAVCLGEALIRSGITLKSRKKGGTYDGAMCWGCPSGENNTHPLKAQELADWLKKRPFAGCPAAQVLTGQNYKEKVEGKCGIIFFKDYWQRPNEKGTKARTGDHIDLWESGIKMRNRLASYGWLSNVGAVSMDLSIDGLWSDKTLSKEVLFWEIK